MESQCKTCYLLNPIPTQLLKETIDIFLPVLSKIVNLSLQTGHVSAAFKTAIMTPLLKKQNLPLELKNIALFPICYLYQNWLKEQ